MCLHAVVRREFHLPEDCVKFHGQGHFVLRGFCSVVPYSDVKQKKWPLCFCVLLSGCWTVRVQSYAKSDGNVSRDGEKVTSTRARQQALVA